MPPRTRQAEQRLVHVMGLSETDAQRVVAEVIDCFDCNVDAYVEERHRELQRAGVGNPSIYATIAAELRRERFLAPELSARQIRRRIYG